jgi:release factor glutamine methyltransferase
MSSSASVLASALLPPAARRLADAGCVSPRSDVRTLLAFVLGVEPHRLATTPVDAGQVDRFAALVDARAAGRPVQYLTGVAYFRTVAVSVGPGVFIPRPETESLAGWAVKRLADIADDRTPVVVELCAGSGAISLAIAAERPGCEQHAVENDVRAFRYLRRNLAGCAGPAAMDLVCGDMADALPGLNGRADMVVANPPYIPEDDRGLVVADVLANEPAAALFSGRDGLDALRVVVRTATRLLLPGGWVGIEHDETTGPGAVAVLTHCRRFGNIEDHIDLTGRPRFVTAQLLAG